MRPVEVRDGDKWAKLTPYNGFKVNFEIDFDHPVLRKHRQSANLEFSTTAFLREISRARTFGFLRDLETLRERPAWQPMPEAVKARIRSQPLPRQGESLEKVYEAFQRDVLPYGGGNLHPRFWGWVMGNGTPGGVLAEMLAATLNPNLEHVSTRPARATRPSRRSRRPAGATTTLWSPRRSPGGSC